MSAESNEAAAEHEHEHEEQRESARAPKRRRSVEPEPVEAEEVDKQVKAPEPWWHSKLLVSLLTLVGASVAPTTTWLNAEQQRATEAVRAAHVQALQQQEQQHAVRMEFFEKVVSPTIAMTPESRLEALRYFQAVLPPGDLRKWAETEYQSLQQLLAERRQADAERAKNAGEASAAAATVDRALSELQAVASDDVEKRNALTAEIEAKTTEAKTLAKRAKEAERKLEVLTRQVQDSVPTPTRVSDKAVAEASKIAAPAAAMPAQPATPEPAIEPLEVRFKAKQEYLAEAKDETYYTFSVALDAPAPVLARIARVDYLFDHPTFNNKNLVSRDRNTKFEVSYRGWGCLSEVIATITLVDGHKLRESFDQCAAIPLSKP